MYALTVKQPWATAIVAGWKDIENRSWRRDSIVGQRIAIHAGIRPAGITAVDRVEQLAGVRVDLESLPHGAILGTVLVVGIVQQSESPWFEPGGLGWQLADARALAEPIAYRGAQLLWRVRQSIAARIESELGR